MKKGIRTMINKALLGCVMLLAVACPPGILMAAAPTKAAHPPAAHPAGARSGALPGKAKNNLRRSVEAKALRPARAGPPAAAAGTKAPARAAKQGKPARAFVVAIDAGHGGKDTGAIGPNGVMEKTVVLGIARRLAGFVRAEPGMRAVMVRSGDEFVDLRRRAAVARDAKADLFVSVHADAYADGGVKGSSVFTLSDHGASSEAARWLADRENAALLGGPKLKNKDKLLASVLVDLSKNATLEASDRAAERVMRELKKGFAVHRSEVQRAGFVVLKSLDMPSMLVETAFISNPEQERKLADAQHQERLARAVFRGIRAYFAQSRLGAAGLRMAEGP
jgi:N-acetylmuramoyl-L-alanine amidase